VKIEDVPLVVVVLMLMLIFMLIVKLGWPTVREMPYLYMFLPFTRIAQAPTSLIFQHGKHSQFPTIMSLETSLAWLWSHAAVQPILASPCLQLLVRQAICRVYLVKSRRCLAFHGHASLSPISQGKAQAESWLSVLLPVLLAAW
jgi:hypothetical protein